MPCNINWEKRNVYVVEGIPAAYSQYAYSKRIFYVDKDFWAQNFSEMYDNGGELWKLWFNMYEYGPKPYEGYPTKPLRGGQYNYTDDWAFTPHGMMADLQVVHSTKWDAPSGYEKREDWVNEWYFNEAVEINTAAAFSVNFLIQSAR